jgi:hypothetical protein
MMVFPIRIEHTLDVPVQPPHDADAREHRRARPRSQPGSMLPLRGIVNDPIGNYITKLPKAEHESPRPICLHGHQEPTSFMA